MGNGNDSQSDIKSTDGSHHNQNPNAISLKKFEKVSILPDIKVNIIFDAQKNKSDSDNYDSDGFENKNLTYLKLPKINKGINNTNDTQYNHLKMTKHANFNNNDSKCNNSMEIQINTQYSKKNKNTMGKKMNQLKKQYVSPYSQKMIF